MTDPVTNNVSLTLPTIGGDTGTWGTPLNGDITSIDALFGANFSTSITNADVTLTTTQFQNGIFVVTGTLTGNHSLIVPLSTNSSTTACGGKFIVANNGAGAFNLTVKTATTGTGTIVPQGFAAHLYSDGANVKFATNGTPGYALASNGTPVGSLTGTAGSVNTNASIAWDYVNNKFYVSTGSTNWVTPVVTLTYPLIVAQLSAPNVQVFTSGSAATYTTPTFAATLPLYLRVRMCAGGGGGNGGGAGGNTSFASWTTVGGSPGSGALAGGGGAGGSGGTNGTGTVITRVAGGSGGAGAGSGGAGLNWNGGSGGNNPFGGAGGSAQSAGANTGAGGGGAPSGAGGTGGGGAGEYVEFIVTSPAASYTYTVGAAGSSNGAAGRIEVIAYWQ